MLVALGLIAAMPSAGRALSSEPQTFPAESLVPNDEARMLFETLRSHILTPEVIAGFPTEQTRPLDQVIDQTLTRGEQVPNWRSSGTDLLAIVSAMEGGVAGNVASEPGEFGPTLVYFVDRPLDEFARAGLELVGRRGEPFEGANVQIEIEHLSPKVLLAERIAYRREGNAYCRVSSESRLYADPSVPASLADMVVVIMTMRALPVLEQRGMCGVVVERAPGQYVMRAFDGQGYRLPAFDTGTEGFRIISLAESRNQSNPQ